MEGQARDSLLTGPDELTLVRSGLDDTMREAYGEIREVHLLQRQDQRPPNRRLRRLHKENLRHLREHEPIRFPFR